MTKVACIIPTIPGREVLLERALASARAQTRPFDEIIVEADPSRTGAADTRNRALERAARREADWVTFLDDDDELLPNHVEVCLKRIGWEDRTPNLLDERPVTLVYTYAEFIGSRDPLATDDGTGRWVKPLGVPFGPAQERHLRTKGNFIPVTHMVRLQAVLEVGGFPRQNEFDAPVSRDCEDYGLLLRLLDAGARFVHEPVITWRYYFHEANTGGRAGGVHLPPLAAGGRRVFGWLADRAGCGYYRLQLPLEELARRGWHTAAAGKLPADWADRFDVIVGQRVCHDGTSQRWREICRSGKALTVYEIDDALMMLHDGHGDDLKSYFGPERVAHIGRNAAEADIVTVTTPALAEIMSGFNKNVVILPNCPDESLLSMPRGVLTGIADRVIETKWPVFVGWQGSPTHGRDFAECWPALKQALAGDERVWLVTMGADYRGPLPAASAGRAVHLGWVEADWESYYRSIACFDITMAPLATQDTFNASKSDLRVREAAMLGQPVIASASRAYAGYVRHGKTGFLVKQEHEWRKYLRMLINDQGLREAMGAAAREYASAHTMQRNVHRWAEAYGGTIGAL